MNAGFTTEVEGVSPRAGAARFYGIEVLGAVGGTLLTTGIFFYTHHRLGWGLQQNFRLAAVQGLIYTAGALLAARLAARVRPRRALALLHGAMAGLAALGATAAGSARVPLIVGTLLAYTFLSAVAWPILEGLVSSGLDARALSRRVATYNLVWSGTMAVALAISGRLIQSWAAAVLAVPAAAHALAAVWALAGDRGAAGADVAAPTIETAAQRHPPEPELLRVRTQALWVSRLALPATYCVIYGLMPMMPSLPVMRPLAAGTQTLVGSTWLAARWVAFVALAVGTWWHSRPRLLLAAAWLMLLAFLGMTLRPSTLFSGTPSPHLDLAWMIAWQALLGGALGVIYSGSLYFGMVLSDGSTEHGGYHEALIGLGWVLGPAVGAAAGWIRPGGGGAGVAAIAAIGALIALSVLATCAAGFVAGRRRRIGQIGNE